MYSLSVSSGKVGIMSRRGVGNRLRWDPEVLRDTLAHTMSTREVVAAFSALPTSERLDFLLRLDELAAARHLDRMASPPRQGGEN